VNAYSKALELDSSQAALWANRAAAHLALGQAGECVQDCSAAIELVQALHTKLQEAPGSEAQAREVQASLLAKPLLPAAAGDQLPAAAAAVDGEGASSSTRDEAPAASSQQQPRSEAGGSSSGPAGHAPAQFPPAGSSQPVDVAAQLQRQLVKLLARRAAAYVECHQLQEAQADLQAALRLDPGSRTLQADALEVAAALSPDGSSDPHSLKARADARFRAGNMHGAAEAYTAILQLLPPAAPVDPASAGGGDDDSSSRPAGMQESQQQQQQLRVAAVSNRAACWLSLNEYARCIADCSSALAGILAPHEASSQGGSNGMPQLHPPQVLLQLPEAMAKSAARLAARLAAAHCCLKQLPAADAAYGWAAAAWAVLGEPAKAAAIASDQQRMQQLAVASEERGGGGVKAVD
jgi:tetratricopeptide (TPR) repeat protein